MSFLTINFCFRAIRRKNLRRYFKVAHNRLSLSSQRRRNQVRQAFSDIGELWLSGDHYKWRAMRLCGVDESYITGNRSYKEKF